MSRVYRDKQCLIVQNTYVNFKTGELLSPIETNDFTVVQVAESYFIGGFKTGEHTQHCDLELTIPLTGALTSFANEVSERIEKNEIFLSYKGEKHRLNSKGSCRFLTLAINFKESSGHLFLEIQKQFSKKRCIPYADPLAIASRIAAEFSNEENTFFTSYVNALITELLVNIIRAGSEKHDIKKQSSYECISEIANYIDSNFLNICSAEELCRFGYSYQYICKIFYDTYGVSPGRYLLSKRMDHAAHRLSKGDSVSGVSQLLGYSSPYNFSRAFKKHFGYPPSRLITG